jgi:hypothetical protein
MGDGVDDADSVTVVKGEETEFGVVQNEIFEVGDGFDVVPGLRNVCQFVPEFLIVPLFVYVGPKRGVGVGVGGDGVDDGVGKEHGFDKKGRGGRVVKSLF